MTRASDLLAFRILMAQGRQQTPGEAILEVFENELARDLSVRLRLLP
jgi:hypothetical protein